MEFLVTIAVSISLFFSSLFGGVFGWFNIFQTQAPITTTTAEQTPVATTTPQREIAASGWRIYHSDPPYNFSIEYPPDWGWITTDAAADGRNWQIQFTGTTTGQNGIRDYLDLSIDLDTLSALEGALLNKREITINGVPAWEGTSSDYTLRFEIQVIVEYNGHVYHFRLPAGAPIPMQVLQTFKIKN